MGPSVPTAVREALRILELTSGLRRALSPHEGPMDETIAEVIRAFTAVGARWCVVGAHAVNVYTEPRATADFDFVIDVKKEKATLRELERAFGELNAVDIDAAIRLPALHVDLIRTSTHELFREAVERATEREGWRVPPVEVLLALKFLSSTSGFRGVERKLQDAADLARLYRSADPDALDRGLLRQLAAKVYPGAERELDALLERIDRGDPITI